MRYTTYQEFILISACNFHKHTSELWNPSGRSHETHTRKCLPQHWAIIFTMCASHMLHSCHNNSGWKLHLNQPPLTKIYWPTNCTRIKPQREVLQRVIYRAKWNWRLTPAEARFNINASIINSTDVCWCLCTGIIIMCKAKWCYFINAWRQEKLKLFAGDVKSRSFSIYINYYIVVHVNISSF